MLIPDHWFSILNYFTAYSLFCILSRALKLFAQKYYFILYAMTYPISQYDNKIVIDQ